MQSTHQSNENQQIVDMAMAEAFLQQAKKAYAAGDMSGFEAARAVVLVNLGLPTDRK